LLPYVRVFAFVAAAAARRCARFPCQLANNAARLSQRCCPHTIRVGLPTFLRHTPLPLLPAAACACTSCTLCFYRVHLLLHRLCCLSLLTFAAFHFAALTRIHHI
jgi:hypothetical protein